MAERLICLLLVFSSLIISVPVYSFNLTFTPDLSVSTEYTDNLFLSERREENDLITIFSPNFSLELRDRHHGIDFSYSPSYSMYKNWTENNTWRHRLHCFAWTDISARTRIEIDDAFLRTEDPLDEEDVYLPDNEPLVSTDATRERGRSTYWTNTARLNLTHQFGRDDSFFVRYIHGMRKTNDPEDEDNLRHSPSIGVTYWFGPTWGFDTEIGYTKTDYSGGSRDSGSDDFDEWDWSLRMNRRFGHQLEGFIRYECAATDYEGDEEDYTTHNFVAGFEYDLSRHAHISFDAGYFIQDNEDSEDEGGMVLNASFVERFRRGSVTFSGSRGQTESRYGAENLGFSEYYEVSCEGSYMLTRRITADIAVSYRKDMYKDEDPERDDKTKRFSTGLTWLCRDWLSFNVDYSYNVVESTDDAESYRENRWMFTITLTPPRPYRLN